MGRLEHGACHVQSQIRDGRQEQHAQEVGQGGQIRAGQHVAHFLERRPLQLTERVGELKAFGAKQDLRDPPGRGARQDDHGARLGVAEHLHGHGAYGLARIARQLAHVLHAHELDFRHVDHDAPAGQL
ncbi:MAG: hypothetical protein P8Z36_04600 [Gemmatimonadota bacterium]